MGLNSGFNSLSGDDRNDAAVKAVVKAVRSGDPERLLKEIQKVTTFARNREAGEYILRWAAGCGHAQIVREVSWRDVDINSRFDNDQTPLHLATVNGFARVVEELISLGADVNARSRTMQTPLHKAATKDNAEIFSILIAAGAKLEVRDDDGKTPADCACRCNGGRVKSIIDHMIRENPSLNIRMIYSKRASGC